MIKNKIIYCPIILLAIFVVYLYAANAFIYYRISLGGFIAPTHREPRQISNNMINVSTTTYVALGDSLTAGVGADKYEETYPYLLGVKFSETESNVVIKNFSTPGFKTQDLIDQFLDETIKTNPQIITLLIGVNDIHNHVGKDNFKKNYEFILSRLTKETKAKIYLINIPYIGSNTAIVPPLNYYFDEETNSFNEIIKELSVKYGLKYIDLNSPTKDLFKRDGEHYSVDSFHPSAFGYKLWANIIYDRLNQ